MILGTLYLIFPHASPELALPGLAAGVALCLSIDQVYRRVIRRDTHSLHSADALLTLVFLTGLATSSPIVAWTAAALKVVLFVSRGRRIARGVKASLGVTRIALVVAACLVPAWSIAFLLAIAGELIDRWSFYEELEPTTPARRMVVEMSARMRTERVASVRS